MENFGASITGRVSWQSSSGYEATYREHIASCTPSETHGGDVIGTLLTDIDRRAIEACRQTRHDAVRLLASINEGGDTYFDRSDVAADVDVTKEHASFFQSVIDRMDIALAAFEARTLETLPT
ncbi:MAG TPA: hypothetical protein VF631_11925 [Allosphingosinicella sp.]|uniref:hypothetical protein n=1 Tax=Allosphingosinicella sp. TaxID=2823234 RepID=UPI002F2AB6D3